jgi:hypothetical protein
VYNVRVAECHTYFVGCPEWGFSAWAHNAYNPTEGTPQRDQAYQLANNDASWSSGSAEAANTSDIVVNLEMDRLPGASSHEHQIPVWSAEQRTALFEQQLQSLPEHELSPELVEALQKAAQRQADSGLEHGGSIIRNAEGQVEYRPGPPGIKGEYPFENHPVPEAGEELLGHYHTHPADIVDGLPVSAQDIIATGETVCHPNMAVDPRFQNIVQAGSRTFVLRVEDDVQAIWRTTGPGAAEGIVEQYHTINRQSSLPHPASFLEAAITVLQGTGITLARGVPG